MKSDSIVFGIAGIAFGLIAGWIIGSQQANRGVAPAAAVQTAAPPPAGAQATRTLCDMA